MDYGPGKRIEEQEIIETYVTECRRSVPVSQREAFENGLPTSTAERSFEEQTFHPGYRSTSETFIHSTNGATEDSPDRRYFATGERDYSRDASFLQNAGTASFPQSPVRETRQVSNGRGIETYGYDVHEVHTSEGGARIVQTRGSGRIDGGEGPLIEQRDRSLSEQHTADGRRIERNTTLIEERIIGERRPGISSVLKTGSKDLGYVERTSTDEARRSGDYLQQVYAVTSPATLINDKYETERHVKDSSLPRKNSYKRMQQGQLDESLDVYTPRSDASLIRDVTQSRSAASEQRQSWTERVRVFFEKLVTRIRNIEWTPRLIGLLLLLLLLLILFFILLAVIISAAFGAFSVKKLILYPPICEECRRRTPPGDFEQKPSTLYIHYYSSNQAHLELKGNAPLKSNSFTAIDFGTGYIATADHALSDGQGKHTTCFVMPLDRAAIPSMDVLKDAISSSSTEVQAENGWQEFWQFQPEQIDALSAERKFSEKIEQCEGARWYFLKNTVYTRDSRCSDCYDFCLPDYGAQRQHKYKDDMTLNIRRLDCFRLYVPEWTKFQIRSDSQGGHWQYPSVTINNANL